MNCLTNNKNKRGFSLIELMVVVAIMGILASIGIPQYLSYRDRAAWGGLSNELEAVNRAFVTCISTRTFDQCTSIQALGLRDFELGATGGVANTTPNFCLDIDRMIGAYPAMACVTINALTGNNNITINRRACAMDGGVSLWDAGATPPGWDTSGGMIAGVDATTAPGVNNCSGTMARFPCTANWDGMCANACGDTRDLTEECTENTYCAGLTNFDYCSPAGETGICGTNGICG